MQISQRKLGWASIIFWLGALMSIDHLIGLQEGMTRWHMGVWHLWVSSFNAVAATLLAFGTTFLWIRSRNARSMIVTR